jgi:regulator of sirC expression with transglutaminase-like and TPR domain
VSRVRFELRISDLFRISIFGFRILGQVMPFDLDEALAILGRDPGADFDLAQVALHLARDEYPTLDVEGSLAELGAMARDARPYLRGPLPERVRGLCRYLFHEMGFRGNARDYYDPRNSYLNAVLERRTGIPITLSAVTIAVGRRAGLEVVGVGLPGHFIAKAVEGGAEVLIDPFHGGRVLTKADCENLVRQVTGVPFEASPLALAPAPVGLIVQRMLNNLKAIYLGREDWGRSARVLERLRQLSPHDAGLRRDLGVCLFRHGWPGKAVDHLQAYLDAVPEADDAGTITEVLNSARQRLAEWN